MLTIWHSASLCHVATLVVLYQWGTLPVETSKESMEMAVIDYWRQNEWRYTSSFKKRDRMAMLHKDVLFSALHCGRSLSRLLNCLLMPSYRAKEMRQSKKDILDTTEERWKNFSAGSLYDAVSVQLFIQIVRIMHVQGKDGCWVYISVRWTPRDTAHVEVWLSSVDGFEQRGFKDMD
jgi:hypothetical protein